MRNNKTNEQPQHKRTKMAKKKLVFNDDNDWVCAVCGLRYSAELILKKEEGGLSVMSVLSHIITSACPKNIWTPMVLKRMMKMK